jgi:UPF0716 protein FxsA
MMLRLLLLFTVVPLTELWLLVRVGKVIGFGPTLLMVLVTGVVGAALARREGLRILGQIQKELNAGHLPGDQMIDGLLILIAGAVLITPGILTDVAGFALLVPGVRSLIRTGLKKRFRTHIQVWPASGPRAPRQDEFIDVEARPVGDEDESQTDTRSR